MYSTAKCLTTICKCIQVNTALYAIVFSTATWLKQLVQGFQTVQQLHTCASDMTEIRRLPDVPGYQNKSNDLIFCGSLSPAKQNVIFFGGDVQDYPEIMLKHRDNKHYVQWNLEATSEMMQSRFPDSHVWLVKAKGKALLTFSIYSNLVPSVDLGNPEHVEGFKSWHHLKALLTNATSKMQGETDSCESGGETNNCAGFVFSSSLPLTLVAFSKGCIVLNQLLYDLAEAKADPEVSSFVGLVRHMFWLDGGHNGGSNTWIIHENILKHLVGMDVEVHSHVTPYQVKDTNRAWISKEQKKFVERLRRLGVKVTSMLHFEEEERSIDIHFNILKAF